MWRWLTNNHQTLTGIGAMLVGIAALFVAWDQGRVMRAQQHGAVFPVLQVDGFVSNTPSDSSLGIRISNNGVGPALIQGVSLYRDGERQTDLDAYRAVLPDGYDLSWSGLTGRALAPNEAISPIQITWPAGAITAAELYGTAAEWDRWDLTVCYCSVFGRCWESSPVGGALAERVRACAPPSEDVFERLGETTSAQSTTETSETADARPEENQ
jgi:hypothetical protein